MRPILILATVFFAASAAQAQDAAEPTPVPMQALPPAEQAKVPDAAQGVTVPPTPLNQKKFDQAAAAYDAKDYATAYKLFTELADEYDIAAMRNVALMTRDGLGCDKDPRRAEDMMKEAARRGLPTAQYDLGEMLLDGAAGPPDAKAAVPWLEMASSAGHPIAQFRLGELYEDGTAVPKDVKVAELLYGAAARRGYDPALQRLKALKGWTTVPKELYEPGPNETKGDTKAETQPPPKP
jgi:TPR repeat protein